MRINGKTAAEKGLKTGDRLEITTFRPHGHAMVPSAGEVRDTAVIPVWVTEGIHPCVLAVSNTLGNPFHGRAAAATNGPRQNIVAFTDNVIAEDQDLRDDIWWDLKNGGSGADYNLTAIPPMQSAPLVGMQGWYDTVCSIRKLQRQATTTKKMAPLPGNSGHRFSRPHAHFCRPRPSERHRCGFRQWV